MGFYIYMLVDPRDGKPFYLVKGKGDRAVEHLKLSKRNFRENPRKTKRILEIRESGRQPRIVKIIENIGDENLDYFLEASLKRIL